MEHYGVTVWDWPLSKYGFVVPRENELAKIHDALFSRCLCAASIEGGYGIGKTFLAKQYAEKYKKKYTGGIYYFPSPLEALEQSNNSSNNSLSLYIIDETTGLAYDNVSLLKFFERYKTIYSKSNVHIILIGHDVPDLLLQDGFRLKLQVLTVDEINTIINEYIYRTKRNLSNSSWENLVYRSNGNKRQLLGLIDLYEQGELNFIHYEGFVDTNGKPLSKHNHIEIDIATINRKLLKAISNDPELLFKLSSREFEFLVGDLWSDEGYEVLVTPATRDGGKDIYAARKTSYGSFLYIVECKRNDKNQRVGVHVVRNLYGVLMQEKATYSMVATTSYFTNPAIEFQQSIQNQMTLCDYDKLVQWIREKDWS